MRSIFIYIPFVKNSIGPKILSYVSSSNEKRKIVTTYGLTRLLNKICKTEDKKVKKCNCKKKAFDIYIDGHLCFRVEQNFIDETEFPDFPNIKQIKDGK
jgi:hypothetical protein